MFTTLHLLLKTKKKFKTQPSSLASISFILKLTPFRSSHWKKYLFHCWINYWQTFLRSTSEEPRLFADVCSYFFIKWKCWTQFMFMLFLLLLQNINFRAAMSNSVELSNMLLNNCWETFMPHYWSQMNFPEMEPLKIFVTADRERREKWDKVYCGIQYFFSFSGLTYCRQEKV